MILAASLPGRDELSDIVRWFNWTDMFDKWPADDIADVCQRVGLSVVSSHVSYPTIFDENLDELVSFCHKVGMDYVSCSPYRVPVARLAAAHAALEEKE